MPLKYQGTWIFKKSRKREIVNARQVYIYLIRKATIINEDPKQKERRESPTALARYIGCHHATIYYSEDMAQNYYDTEENIRQLIDRLLKELLIGKNHPSGNIVAMMNKHNISIFDRDLRRDGSGRDLISLIVEISNMLPVYARWSNNIYPLT